MGEFLRLSAEQFRKLALEGQPKCCQPKNKYHALKTTFNGTTYDSRKEAGRGAALERLQAAHKIKGLEKQKEFVLTKQLLRSGTSIGANIREAKYAHSKADFVAKLQISLKECYETEYWIEIAQKANIISEEIAKNVLHDCGSIRRMLIASINTAKEGAK